VAEPAESESPAPVQPVATAGTPPAKEAPEATEDRGDLGPGALALWVVGLLTAVLGFASLWLRPRSH
jgi:hypothetical protein